MSHSAVPPAAQTGDENGQTAMRIGPPRQSLVHLVARRRPSHLCHVSTGRSIAPNVSQAKGSTSPSKPKASFAFGVCLQAEKLANRPV